MIAEDVLTTNEITTLKAVAAAWQRGEVITNRPYVTANGPNPISDQLPTSSLPSQGGKF